MRILFIILLSFCVGTLFSQTVFESCPSNAREIHYVYEVKSNYIVNQEGVFADTLLFKIDFPKLKVQLRKHPNDSTRLVGFVASRQFGNENKTKLRGILYHTNEVFYATHFIIAKKTVLNVVRGDEETRRIFKEFFKDKFYDFKYRLEFDFVKKTEKRNYPNVNYNLPFEKVSKTVEIVDNQIGVYYESYKNVLYKNIITFNQNLNPFVSPYVFENNTMGVEKLETIAKTITLKSVTYQ
ncbi:hypothetical protein [Flavobacterium sp.]|uniref:hypothetical protein n=1 Tax=Flavobacterium sp. TaxID=239 RepID=UPI002FDE1039